MRSSVKTEVVKARRSLGDSSVETAERDAATLAAFSVLDRAAAKGVVHPNNAARRKSRLARQLAKLASAAPTPAKGKKASPAKAAAPATKKK